MLKNELPFLGLRPQRLVLRMKIQGFAMGHYESRRASDRKATDPGSILELAMRRCVLGKDALYLFPIGAKQFTCCGGPV